MTRAKGDCSFDGCTRPRLSKGLCSGHYQQQARGKGLTPLKSRSKPGEGKGHAECSFDGCTNTVNALGLCSAHYQQQRKGQELRPVTPKLGGAVCAVDDCGAAAHSGASGEPLCSSHHNRWVRYDDARTVTKGDVRRLVMAKLADEVAHRSRSGCWDDWSTLLDWSVLRGWGGSTDDKGYPRFGADPVMHLVKALDGDLRPAAPGNVCRHVVCDNPACFNPDHLQWGTAGDNARDRTGKMNYCRHCAHCAHCTAAGDATADDEWWD